MALACVSTHDHQTFNGWWRQADIDLRLQHGLVLEETTKEHRKGRGAERERLLEAFRQAGLYQDGETSVRDADLVSVAYGYIARTPSLLVSVRLADMTDEKAATNVPGTDRTYPNWRPKLSYAIHELPSLPLVVAIASVMREARPS